jgi:hypothetical protein
VVYFLIQFLEVFDASLCFLVEIAETGSPGKETSAASKITGSSRQYGRVIEEAYFLSRLTEPQKLIHG